MFPLQEARRRVESTACQRGRPCFSLSSPSQPASSSCCGWWVKWPDGVNEDQADPRRRVIVSKILRFRGKPMKAVRWLLWQNQAKTYQIYLNDFSCMYSCKFVLGRDSIKLPFVARCISCMLLVASYLLTICRAESKSCQSRQMMPLETYFCSFYAKMAPRQKNLSHFHQTRKYLIPGSWTNKPFWESTAISRHFLKFLLIGDFQDGWARF